MTKEINNFSQWKQNLIFKSNRCAEVALNEANMNYK